MRALGFARFRLAGHDRGGRVSHRLCVDHPRGGRARRGARHLADADHVRQDRPGVRDRVLPLVLPDPAVRPAGEADRRGSGLLPAQEDRRLGVGGRTSSIRARFAEYERCFRDPATIHATCEDYRAAASIDLEHDDADVAAGRKVTCPLLVLWGDKGVVHRYFDPVADWRTVATRRARARAAVGSLPRRGGAGGDAGRAAWRSSRTERRRQLEWPQWSAERG